MQDIIYLVNLKPSELTINGEQVRVVANRAAISRALLKHQIRILSLEVISNTYSACLHDSKDTILDMCFLFNSHQEAMSNAVLLLGEAMLITSTTAPSPIPMTKNPSIQCEMQQIDLLHFAKSISLYVSRKKHCIKINLEFLMMAIQI